MTVRDDPPPAVPPCPRCKATRSEYDENYPALPWFCIDCKTEFAGTATEAMQHAARVIADNAIAADLANKPSTLKAIRDELDT